MKKNFVSRCFAVAVSMALFLLVMSVVIVSPTMAKTKKTPINVSILFSQSTAREDIKAMFAAISKQENITIDMQTVPEDQFHPVKQAKFAAKEMPDIISGNIPQEYVMFEAEKNFVDLSNEPWVKRLSNPEFIKHSDGKIYGFPRYLSEFYGACYYNKKLWDKLGLKEPTTYTEFLALLEKVKNSGEGLIPLFESDKDMWCTQVYTTIGWGVAASGQKDLWPAIMSGKKKFSDVPAFKEILKRQQDLYLKGYVNKDHLTATYEMAKEAVATGKALMFYNGEWFANDIKAKWPDVELGSFIIPHQDKQVIAVGKYVEGYMIPKWGKNVANAKKLLNLLSQTKYQNIGTAIIPGSPAFKGVKTGDLQPCIKNLINKYVKKHQYVFEADSEMEFARPVFQSELWPALVSMTAGQMTPEQVLKYWDDKFSAYMKAKHQPGF